MCSQHGACALMEGNGKIQNFPEANRVAFHITNNLWKKQLSPRQSGWSVEISTEHHTVVSQWTRPEIGCCGLRFRTRGKVQYLLRGSWTPRGWAIKNLKDLRDKTLRLVDRGNWCSRKPVVTLIPPSVESTRAQLQRGELQLRSKIFAPNGSNRIGK